MEIEMEELKKERDNACSQLEELRKKMGGNQKVSFSPFFEGIILLLTKS
jgi:centromeric protein E